MKKLNKTVVSEPSSKSIEILDRTRNFENNNQLKVLILYTFKTMLYHILKLNTSSQTP